MPPWPNTLVSVCKVDFPRVYAFSGIGCCILMRAWAAAGLNAAYANGMRFVVHMPGTARIEIETSVFC